MLRHRAWREKHRGAPLDEQPLLGISIVAGPEFIEIRHETIVDAASSACAVLDYKVWIFSPDPFEGFEQAEVIVHVKMALFVGTQVGRT